MKIVQNGITKDTNYLAHAGKKGMKWGYNNEKANGNRTAGTITVTSTSFASSGQSKSPVVDAGYVKREAKETKAFDIMTKKAARVTPKAKSISLSTKISNIARDVIAKGKALINKMFGTTSTTTIRVAGEKGPTTVSATSTDKGKTYKQNTNDANTITYKGQTYTQYTDAHEPGTFTYKGKKYTQYK